MSNRIVLIYSGGLDSTVALYRLKEQGNEVFALSVDYGQRHRKEIEYARLHTSQLKVTHEVADLRGVRHLLGGSSQTSDEIAVPDGHYAEEAMKITIVPNRNMIMLATAIGWAISLKANSVAYAAHAGDHTIYPDCRPEFVDALEKAAWLCDWRRMTLTRPFINWTKADIVTEGAKRGVAFEHTWSCYKGQSLHCGKCGTCVERREAFALAGVTDPTTYEVTD